jgi:hypothetical protein
MLGWETVTLGPTYLARSRLGCNQGLILRFRAKLTLVVSTLERGGYGSSVLMGVG